MQTGLLQLPYINLLLEILILHLFHYSMYFLFINLLSTYLCNYHLHIYIYLFIYLFIYHLLLLKFFFVSGSPAGVQGYTARGMHASAARDYHLQERTGVLHHHSQAVQACTQDCL